MLSSGYDSHCKCLLAAVVACTGLYNTVGQQSSWTLVRGLCGPAPPCWTISVVYPLLSQCSNGYFQTQWHVWSCLNSVDHKAERHGYGKETCEEEGKTGLIREGDTGRMVVRINNTPYACMELSNDKRNQQTNERNCPTVFQNSCGTLYSQRQQAMMVLVGCSLTAFAVVCSEYFASSMLIIILSVRKIFYFFLCN